MRSWEAEYLWEQATPSYPAVRREPEPDSPMRTPFQRDRDRIVHSKAFRRLKHKTQVFIAPEGDHYRTRLTHTIETCGIARTVARALGLNEDLTEAIGLGHDLGHPPFGHIGEEALDQALRENAGRSFRHNRQSLRVVDVLERDGHGLNLTEPVRDGILNHTGSEQPITLEGRIVRLVDRVAYINHDLDDALRAGIITAEDLPAAEIELLGPTGAERIDTLAQDIVDESRKAGDIAQSEEIGEAMLLLRKFMFERVYLGEEARSEHERVHRTLQGAVRPLHRASGGGAGGRDGRRRDPADHRLHRRDDRPVLHRDLQAPGAAGGVAALSKFTSETVERVKEATDIVEIVSAYTDLRRAGERFTGLCPFHEERTPSFSVDPREKLYHCFGCGAGGDVIKFVEEKEGLGFPEAVEALADRYGVELERESEDPRAEEARKRRARLGELLERTAQFYAAYLWDSHGGGEGARVPGVAGARRGGAAGVRGRVRAERLGQVLTRGQRAGFGVPELAGGGPGAEGPEGRALRPLPRADHVPGARPARAACRGSGRGRCGRTRSRST